jgi:hypothetical protein
LADAVPVFFFTFTLVGECDVGDGQIIGGGFDRGDVRVDVGQYVVFVEAKDIGE